MTNTCALSALWTELASVAALLAIRFKVSTALHEIAAGMAITRAVIPRGIANTFLLPRLLSQASVSKKSAQANARKSATRSAGLVMPYGIRPKTCSHLRPLGPRKPNHYV